MFFCGLTFLTFLYFKTRVPTTSVSSRLVFTLKNKRIPPFEIEFKFEKTQTLYENTSTKKITPQTKQNKSKNKKGKIQIYKHFQD